MAEPVWNEKDLVRRARRRLHWHAHDKCIGHIYIRPATVRAAPGGR
jgi:hypothetical protein